MESIGIKPKPQKWRDRQPPPLESPQTFNELRERWFSFIEERYSPRTQESYKMILLRFLDYAPKNPKSLSVEHIEIFLATNLKREDFSKKSANNYLTAIKSFCRWASKHHDLPNSAAKVDFYRTPPSCGRHLTHEEYLKVLSVCESDEAEVIKFLASTGLRLSEVRGLAWGNISPDLKSISLVGKGQRHRTIPLNNTCQKILSKYKSYSDIKFLESYRSRPALYRLCRRLGKRAGIEKPFGVHALRHYAATQLHRNGVGISTIARFLGHKSIQCTESVYIHWLGDEMTGLTDVLD